MSDASWTAFWTNLPYLVGAFGTCVVPGVTAFLMMRAHRANLKAAKATREEVVATRTEMTEVKGMVTVATATVGKIEEKTNGWYSPSPGVIYPTLTYLEEVGYLASESEGSKKRYQITPEGESYLKSNRDIVDVVLDRLAAAGGHGGFSLAMCRHHDGLEATVFDLPASAAVGRKMARMRRAFGGEGEGDRSDLPQVVGAAIANLGKTAGKRLEGDADTEAKIVEILMRAANDIKNA